MLADAPTTESPTKVRAVPTGGPLGADIVGFDPGNPSDEDIAAVRQALLDHLVIRIRGTDIDDVAQFIRTTWAVNGKAPKLGVYGGKHLNRTQYPWIEGFTPLYANGPWPPSFTFMGPTNLVRPKLYLYGDFRTAVANNNNAGNSQGIWANRLNLDLTLNVYEAAARQAWSRTIAFFNRTLRG